MGDPAVGGFVLRRCSVVAGQVTTRSRCVTMNGIAAAGFAPMLAASCARAPEAVVFRGSETFLLEDERRALVRAAIEPLLEVRST